MMQALGIMSPLILIDGLAVSLDNKIGHFPNQEEFKEEYDLSFNKEHYEKFVNERYAWTQGKVPMGYWNKQNKIRAIQWVCEKCKKEKKKITKKYFINNGLNGLISKHYNQSPLKALKEAYPKDQIIQETPWLIKELAQVPNDYWQKEENRIKAIKWAYEKCKKEKKKISVTYLINNGLRGLLLKYYNGSPLKVLQATYSKDKVIQETPWLIKEMEKVPRDYWTKENRVKAIKWAYEKCKKEKKKMSVTYLINNGLGGLLQHYNGSPLIALQETYPKDQIIQETPWLIKELAQLPNDYWQKKEDRIKAIKWLYKKAKKENKKITRNLFVKNGLGGFLHHYNSSPLQTLQDAYPKDKVIQETPWLIKELAFMGTYWQKEENRIKAIKWAYEKCKKEKKKINLEYFIKNRLRGLIKNHYNSSPLIALQAAYPEDKVIQEMPWLILRAMPNGYWTEENIVRAIKTVYNELEKEQELIKLRFEEKGLFKIIGWWKKHKKTGMRGLRDFYDNYFINKAKEISKGRNVESIIENERVRGDFEKADVKLVMLALLGNYLPRPEGNRENKNGNGKKSKEIVKIEYQ